MTLPPLLLCFPTLVDDPYVILGCVGSAGAILMAACLLHEGKLLWRITAALVVVGFFGFVSLRAYANAVYDSKPHIEFSRVQLLKSKDHPNKYDYLVSWTVGGKNPIENVRGIDIFDNNIPNMNPIKELVSISGTTYPNQLIDSGIQRINGDNLNLPVFLTTFLKYDDPRTGRVYSQTFYYKWLGIPNVDSRPDLNLDTIEEAQFLQKKYASDFDFVR